MSEPTASTSEDQPTPDTPYKLSNAEVKARWKIDPHQDPYSIELGKLNPGHGDYFEANTALPLFERLRKEAPVHRTEESQYGPYWNVTGFDAIKQVDTNAKLFSSDAMNGGIRLGGQRLDEPDATMTFVSGRSAMIASRTAKPSVVPSGSGGKPRSRVTTAGSSDRKAAKALSRSPAIVTSKSSSNVELEGRQHISANLLFQFNGHGFY